MNLPQRIIILLAFGASLGTAPAAELPDTVRTQAAQFEAAMKQYDASVAAQKKAALDRYIAILAAARKMEEGAKRPAGVTAIDAELSAVKAGPIEGKAPAEFPAILGAARDRFIADVKRAATSNDSNRQRTLDDYLKWLSGTQSAYARVKDTGTIAAIEEEKKRVIALAEARSKP